MRTGKTIGSTLVRAAAWVTVLVLAAALLGGCTARDSSDETLQMTGGAEPMTAPAPDVDGEAAYDMGTEEMLVADESAARSYATGTDASTIPEEDRLIIRNKSLRVEVEDVRETVDTIRDLTGDHGGIVTNVNVASDDGPVYRYDEYGYTEGSGEALSGWITVRVPAEEFEAFVDEAMDLGEVLWENESTDDVTQQHVDLSARLANWQAEEEELRSFFDRAEDVDDLLSIRSQLAQVRGEIEALTAQIEYLERQASMSTVTIELTEPKPVVRPDGPDWGFVDAITSGLQFAANVIRALIYLAIGFLPIAALGLLAYFVIRVLLKRHRKRLAA